MILATSGTAEVLGEPMPKRAHHVLPRVGSLIEGPASYGHLNARTNLMLLDASGPHSDRRTRKDRIEQALVEVGLSGTGRKPVKAFSLGMRQRLGLAAALLQRPELLVLDEPTNGLDPQGIREIRELLLRLNAEGVTVFLSSHLLAEIEMMCTRVGVLDRGRLVLEDTLADLQAPTGLTVVTTSDPAAAVAALERAGPQSRRPATRRRRRASGAGQRAAGAGRRTRRRARRRTTLPGGRHPGPHRTRIGSSHVIGVELRKLARRPRTWLTLILLDALPTIVAILLAVTHLGPRPGQGPAFLSAVLANGSLFSVAALAIVLPLFLPVAVAVIAGDSIAGEAQGGTLRYLLTRPVSRSRLLVAKLVTIFTFVAVAVVVVAGTGYVVGKLLLGNEPLTAATSVASVSGSTLTAGQIAWRTALGHRLRRPVDARRGRAGAAAVDHDRLAAVGHPRRAGVPDRLVAAADPRRVARDQALPADAVLAVVRGPVPRSDPLAKRRAGRAACSSSTSWCSSRPPGPTSRARTSRASRLDVSHSASPTEDSEQRDTSGRQLLALLCRPGRRRSRLG